MYCRYCGEQIEDEAYYCGVCGRRQVNNFENNLSIEQRELHNNKKQNISSSKRHDRQGNGRFQREKKENNSHLLLATIICAVVFILLAILTVALFFKLQKPTNTGDIRSVQNSYLGEYTDVTVLDLFDGYYCALGYPKGEWTSGIAESGHHLVDLKYADIDEMLDTVQFQFWILDNGCFRINGMSDPFLSQEKATDLFYNLNLIHYLQYTNNYRSMIGNRLWEMGLIEKMMSIDGASARYGAPVEYSGDRSRLCEQFNEKSLNVNVALLFDNYGLLKLDEYFSEDEESEDYAHAATVIKTETLAPSEPIPTLPETTVPIPTTQSTDTQVIYTGYVLESSGGLNIRNGPGRDYDQVGRLSPNDRVSVYELKVVGSSTWGRIGSNEWVCVDYVTQQNNKKVSDAAKKLRAVVRGEENFLYCGTAESTEVCEYKNINNIDYLGREYDWVSRLYAGTRFQVVDIDRDGINEVVVDMAGDIGWYMLLHFSDGEVYGNVYGARWLSLSKSGLASASSSAFEGEYFRLYFNGQWIQRTYPTAEDMQQKWEAAEWYELTSANIERYIV